MLILALAMAALLLFTGAAHAEPVTIAIFGAAFAATLPGLVVTAALNIGVSLALSGIAYLLTGSGKRQAGATEPPISIQIPERSGLLERRLLYGTQTVSGGVFFQGTVADSGSSGPDIFVIGFAISDGVCDGLDSLLINGVVCEVDASGLPTTAPWLNGPDTYLKVSFRSGESDQAIDPIIAARFPTESIQFRQRGVATCVIEMAFGESADRHTELWGAGGIPDIKFRVRGRRVYDPRDIAQAVDDESTWAWSANASLIEADWLRHEMGFSISSDEINWASVTESADIDDEIIATLSGTEFRGTINGVILASEANDSVLNAMALSNRATIRRAFGEYTIRADRSATPVCTIHQGLLVGEFTFQNETDTRSALNTVNLQFAPSVNGNQPGETQYVDEALVATDGQVYEASLSLRFTDSPSTAQRLGFALITENRESRTFTGMFDAAVLAAAGKPSGQLLEAGDVVQLWFDNDYDALNGIYTVSNLEISQEFTVVVSLTGYTANVIDGWSTALETEYQENVTSIYYTDYAVTSVDQTAYSFTSLDVGDTAPNRQIIAQVIGYTSASTAANTIPTSVTIGGVAATKLVEKSSTAGGVSNGVSLWGAALPTGATATIAPTFPADNARAGVAVFSLYRDDFTPTASGTDSATGTSDLATAVTVSTRGIYAVHGDNNGVDQSISLTGSGVARVLDAEVDGGSRMAAALLNLDATVAAVSASNRSMDAVWASWD